jgi:hypothetical protein
MKTLTIWLWVCAALALALPAALLLVGCAKDSSCGPGERFKSGMCLPAGSGQKATTPEPEADAGGDGAPVSSGKTAAFGDVCKTNDDCGDPAPVCAIQPTDATGFCSQVDCGADPSVCPAGWSCFDPSVINPDWPTVCVKN